MKILSKKHSPLLLIILLVSSYTFKSCTEDPYKPETLGSIEGQVMDAETNNPLSNVTITTKPSQCDDHHQAFHRGYPHR